MEDALTFTLVGQQPGENAWKAFSFRVTDDNQVVWVGREVGHGTILDQPVNTAEGLFLPVRRLGKHTMHRLDLRAFPPHASGCEAL